MTAAEVRAARPDLVAEVSPQPCRAPDEQCLFRSERASLAGRPATAWFCFRDARLRSVYLRPTRTDGSEVEAALRRDLGQPFLRENTADAPLPPPGADLSVVRLAWMHGATRVEYSSSYRLMEVVYQSSALFPTGGRLPDEPVP